MKKIFKHLLLPFTAILWYFICQYITLGVFIGFIYVFGMNWWYFMFLYLVCIGVISVLFAIPSVANNYLLYKLYDYSWLSLICHSLAGLLGVFSYLNIYWNSDSTSINDFWDISWLKTVLLFFPAMGVIIGMIYSLGISPVLIKLDKKNINE